MIGYDKPEPSRVRCQPPHDEVHLFRQPVPVATNLQEFSGSDKRLQLAPEAGAFVPGYAQHPHQVPHRGGMMGVLANLGQEFFSHVSPLLTSDQNDL